MTTSHVAEFSCCVPRLKCMGHVLKFFILCQGLCFPNIDTLSQHILVLKETKGQLSVYDKMPMLYIL